MAQAAVSNGELPALNAERPASLGRDAIARLLANRLAVAGLVVVTIVFLAALLAPFIAPYDPLSQDLARRFEPPSADHWLGTDELGRDMLSRMLYGARTAVTVALTTSAISLVVGVALGTAAGYFGGGVDAAIVWLIDLIRSVPSLLLAIVINFSLKSPITGWMEDMYLATRNPLFRQTMWVDLILVFGIIALLKWPEQARLVRGQVLSLRNQNYVLAARALGMPTRHIMLYYIIPNVLGPVIVAASAGLGTAMALESAFSFLGIGVPLNVPSWGRMIGDGMRAWRTYPHLLAVPAAVLGIITVAFNFLGDGLNDALNPRRWQ